MLTCRMVEQVVRLRPYTLFTNRVGVPLELRQAGGDQPRTLHPWDWRTTFAFPAVQEPLQLQVNEWVPLPALNYYMQPNFSLQFLA